MHLRINDEHIRGRIMTVCIGSAWGWGQTPSAVPYNGWLDVSVIYRPEFLQIISGLWMLIQGRILNHKVVKSYRTKKVKVLRAQNAAVDLDGRLLPRHFPLEVGVLSEKNNTYYSKLINSGTDYADYADYVFSKSTSAKAV